MDLAALKRDLDGLKIDDNEKIVQQKSRDFYWYSPVLKRQLEHVTGDLIVSPKSQAEVIRVLAACHRHGVPVTPRGTGTGNYGQAMPLSGGVVLSLAEMNAVTSISPRQGGVRAGRDPCRYRPGDPGAFRPGAAGCILPPTIPRPLAASSPVVRVASARSISAACAISAMFCGCAS